MKILEIANILGTTVKDLCSFDQTLLNNPELRQSILTGMYGVVGEYELSQQEASYVMQAYAESDPHNTHGSIA